MKRFSFELYFGYCYLLLSKACACLFLLVPFFLFCKVIFGPQMSARKFSTKTSLFFTESDISLSHLLTHSFTHSLTLSPFSRPSLCKVLLGIFQLNADPFKKLGLKII
jgi:hypothetical protein